MEEETMMIISALSSLSTSKLSDLTQTILSITHRHLLRLSTILSSPSLFFLTLHYLHSLSLPNKSLLIARHLLSSLHHLTTHLTHHTFSTTAFNYIKHRDLDAALLLLLLCELQQHNPYALQGLSSAKWKSVLTQFYLNSTLSLSGGVVNGGCSVLLPYVEMVSRCKRFVRVMGGGGKERKEVAASPAAVVALPSVEVRGVVVECVICREEMKQGREVCELPCQHLFHWMCILPWLRKRNTCPCCRFPLPADDVFAEIQRLWEILVKASGGRLDGD